MQRLFFLRKGKQGTFWKLKQNFNKEEDKRQAEKSKIKGNFNKKRRVFFKKNSKLTAAAAAACVGLFLVGLSAAAAAAGTIVTGTAEQQFGALLCRVADRRGRRRWRSLNGFAGEKRTGACT